MSQKQTLPGLLKFLRISLLGDKIFLGTREGMEHGERLWGLNDQGQVLAASLHPLPKLGWAGVLPTFRAPVCMEDTCQRTCLFLVYISRVWSQVA